MPALLLQALRKVIGGSSDRFDSLVKDALGVFSRPSVLGLVEKNPFNERNEFNCDCGHCGELA